MRFKFAHTKAYVYFLRREGAVLPRYVGCTVKQPLVRLAEHVSPSSYMQQVGPGERKRKWIRTNLAQGHKIELIVLAECDFSICHLVERALIRGLHRAGYPILNHVKYETMKGIVQ